MRRLSQLSGGLPRVINLLCDRSLEEAYASRLRIIDRRLVQTAAAALGIGQPIEPAAERPAAPIRRPRRSVDPPASADRLRRAADAGRAVHARSGYSPRAARAPQTMNRSRAVTASEPATVLEVVQPEAAPVLRRERGAERATPPCSVPRSGGCRRPGRRGRPVLSSSGPAPPQQTAPSRRRRLRLRLRVRRATGSRSGAADTPAPAPERTAATPAPPQAAALAAGPAAASQPASASILSWRRFGPTCARRLWQPKSRRSVCRFTGAFGRLAAGARRSVPVSHGSRGGAAAHSWRRPHRHADCAGRSTCCERKRLEAV